MSGLWEIWKQFFFTDQVAPSTYQLFCYLFGFWVFLENLINSFSKMNIYGPRGFLPPDLHRTFFRGHRFCLFLCFPQSELWARSLLWIEALSGLGIAFQVQPVVSAILIAVLQCSKKNRNTYAVYSGEDVAMILAILLIFAPHPAALALMKLQVSLIYFQSTFHKLKIRSWRKGEMAYKVLCTSNASLAPNWFRKILAVNFLNRVSSWMILILQGLAPILLWWERSRAAMVLACMLVLHLPLQLLMRVAFFQVYMITALVLFLSANESTLVLGVLGLN